METKTCPEDAYDVLESALSGEYGSGGRNVNMSQSVKNDVKNAQRAAHKAANIGLCQDTRATTEQVLDPRTRLILFKLLATKCFCETRGLPLDGQGGERLLRLVRRWTTGHRGDKRRSHNSPFAVKVYKTSILVFRDRRRYVDGEHRFEKGYTSGKNPRKMVQLWAEKELRNYKRCWIRVGNSFKRRRRDSCPSDEVGGGLFFLSRRVGARERARRGDGVVSRRCRSTQAPRARRESPEAPAAEGPCVSDGVHW